MLIHKNCGGEIHATQEMRIEYAAGLNNGELVVDDSEEFGLPVYYVDPTFFCKGCDKNIEAKDVEDVEEIDNYPM